MAYSSRDPDEPIPVRELIEAGKAYLEIELLAGEGGLDKGVTHSRIQKPGLAMAGYVAFIHPGRVQVFGESEIRYLQELGAERRRAILEPICACPLSCVAITKGLEPPAELVELCEAESIPLLRSPLLSSRFIDRLNHFLDAHFAPRAILHGVLVDVLGVGVLIMGPSGLGKSECALDLVLRGHRLVSDDVVEVRCRQGEVIVGRGPELTRYHMEVRGLGIINIAHLFGVASTRERKRVELVVRLTPWDARRDECDRLGLDHEFEEILGVRIPLVRLPVATGRILSNLIEVAARNLLLRLKGYDPARELDARLRQAMEGERRPHFSTGRYDVDEGDLE